MSTVPIVSLRGSGPGGASSRSRAAETPGVGGDMASALAARAVAFAGNAVSGAGGQGEFLRQMGFALQALPGARLFSRTPGRPGPPWQPLPFAGAHRALFEIVRATPGLRARHDWLTLLADHDFDRRLAAAAMELDLLDAVMGQCCRTFERLRAGGRARLVLTSLNTHILHLVATLRAEHRRLGRGGRSFVHPAMRWRALREIALADRIRVNSAWARATFVEQGVPAEKIHVIHPGVDLDHFHPAEKRDAVFRVLAVSSIEPRKGIHYLLEAFLQARLPHSELVLVGGTGDRWSRAMLDGYRRRSAHIRLVAADVLKTPAAETYGAASVVVHPALEDGYGLVVAQALACGRPVIVTRQAGAAELVEDGTTGFVIDSGSAAAIAERLRMLAADSTMRRSMEERAPHAVAHLGYPDFARRVRAFYAGLFEEAG